MTSKPVPPAPSPDTQADELADRFEAEWKQGRAPTIEGFLVGVTEPHRANLFVELLELEISLLAKKGQAPDAQNYAARFPEFANAIERILCSTAAIRGSPAIVLSEDDVANDARSTDASVRLPERYGRYRVTGVLGSGGFGIVYRGYDEELNREVAIKVPKRQAHATPDSADQFLAEARHLASLQHPGIVPVFDVGRTADGDCFVVTRYVGGCALSTQLRQASLPFATTADMVAQIAEALHHAHLRGLVHRDVKPGNILLDEFGKPLVADFGLAMTEDSYGAGQGYFGTPSYMSPEQARGEGHRVDARSDVYSLGVVLYQMLTGRLPYRHTTVPQVFEEITRSLLRPPRQVDDTIPRELDRICLRALARRASDRYSTALDFAEDLRYWLRSAEAAAGNAPASTFTADSTPAVFSTPRVASSHPVTPTPQPISDSLQPLKIVPQGLRSFDANDADFFLELLPGPRDREGLPDGVRFWKTRIETRSATEAFAVGLLYGPSGCGKSSFVKAGLLPRLAKHIVSIHLDASPDQTESRLFNAIRNRAPWSIDISRSSRGFDPSPVADASARKPRADALKEHLAAVRRGEVLPPGQKLLIVLDQFEQWLHGRRGDERAELIAALRQCDGERVQCLVLVRDDFWMATTQFLQEVEVRLVEGQNAAALDLFDMRHARHVLGGFGRSFGTLPENSDDWTAEQLAFLDDAVSELAQDGKVICVRLALFAEMLKSQPWTRATLRKLGGSAGVGVTFLEETFSAQTAPPEHRLHQVAARAVLQALLPQAGTEIRGHVRSRHELLAASGYADRRDDFATLLRILDTELRLITPVAENPESRDEAHTPILFAAAPESQLSTLDTQLNYQLTHDYLVPSLREWLTKKQRETRRGRAELILVERTAAWSREPVARHLPDLLEFLSVRWHTRRPTWAEPQRKLMTTAARYHRRRWGTLFGILSVLVLTLAIGGPIVALRETQLRQQADSFRRESELNVALAEGRLAALSYIQGMDAAEQGNYTDATVLLAKSLGQFEDAEQHVGDATDDESEAQRRMIRGTSADIRKRLANYLPQVPKLHALLDHPGEGHRVEFHPSGRLFVTIANDKCRVWSISGPNDEVTLRHEFPDARHVHFVGDSERLAVVSAVGVLRLFDTKTGEKSGREISRVNGGFDQVPFFSPRGRYVVATSQEAGDKVVTLWNLESESPGIEIGRTKESDSFFVVAKFSPDEQRLWIGDKRLLDTRTGRVVSAEFNHGGRSEIRQSCFRRDSKVLVTLAWERNGDTFSATRRTWNAETGEPLLEPIPLTFAFSNAPGSTIEFTADGRRLLVIDNASRYTLLDANTLKAVDPTAPHPDNVSFLQMVSSRPRIMFRKGEDSIVVRDTESDAPVGEVRQHPDQVLSVTATPDGRWIVTRTLQQVFVWETESGRRVTDFRCPENAQLKVSPDGLWVTVTTNDGVEVWDILVNHRLHRGVSDAWTINTASISNAAMSQDIHRLATSSWDGTAQVWDTETGRPIGASVKHTRPITQIAFSPDGHVLATGSWDHTARLWNARTGQPLCEPLPHRAPLTALAISGDGHWLATAAGNEGQIWDAETGRPAGERFAHTAGIQQLAFSPDNRVLATAGRDGYARLWTVPVGTPLESSTPELRHSPRPTPILSIAWNPSGSRLRLVTAGEDGVARLWSFPFQSDSNSEEVARHSRPIGLMAISPQKWLLATASWDRTVQVWDIRNQLRFMKPLVHADHVTHLVFSPDESMIATACLDGTVRVWDTERGNPVTPPLLHDTELNHVFFSSDGQRLLVVGQTAVVVHRIAEPLTTPTQLLSQMLEQTTARWTPNHAQTVESLSASDLRTRREMHKSDSAIAPNDGDRIVRATLLRNRAIDFDRADLRTAESLRNYAAGIHPNGHAWLAADARQAEPPEPDPSFVLTHPGENVTLIPGAWHAPWPPDADLSIPAWAADRVPFDVRGFLEQRQPIGTGASDFVRVMAIFGHDTRQSVFPSEVVLRKAPTWAALRLRIERAENLQLLERELTADETTEADLLTEQFGPIYDALGKLGQRHAAHPVTGQSFEALLPHIQNARSATRLLVLRMSRQAQRGDLDGAIDSFEVGLSLTRQIIPRGGLIQQLVVIGCDAVLFANLDAILSTPQLTSQHCERLCDLVRTHQAIEHNPWSEGMRMEYIGNRSFIEAIAKGEFSRQYVEEFLLAAVKLDADELNEAIELLNRSFRQIEPMFRSKTAVTYDQAVKYSDEIKNLHATARTPFKELLLTIRPMGIAFCRQRTKENGALAKIAVVHWRLKHGTIPESLEEACREFGLDGVPIDPYSNQPLRYRMIDGQPVVYAIFEDQIDDGGLIDVNDTGWQKGDNLFKVPATRAK